MTFSEELEEYCINLEKENTALREQRMKFYEQILQNLNKQYAFAHFLMHKEKVFDTLPQGYKTLLSKALSDVMVIQNTATLGCVAQGYNILRSLFEAYANLMFINKDFEVRMKHYEGYTIFTQYHQLQKDKHHRVYKNNPNFIRYLKQMEGPLLEKYNSIKDNYKENKDWYFFLLSQDINDIPTLTEKEKKQKRKNFKTLCEIIGNEEIYKILYPSTSNAAHATSLVQNLESPNVDSHASTVVTLLTLSAQFLNQMILVGLERQAESGHEECKKYCDMFTK
ncbi:DUF5677 domain-containing protein [Priestia sp. YIM B13551]|uniref:DUF5677 domain-containing protein n=1 Tax=Priestia sp. YIM B13551 TaxID=3366306 RepID=UPI00366B531C